MITLSPHGVINLDILAQEILFTTRAEIGFYRNLPKNFTSQDLDLGQKLNVKVPAARTAQRKDPEASYNNTAVAAADAQIELTDEVYDKMTIKGTTMHRTQSAMDLRELYAIPSGVCIGEGIISHMRDKVRADMDAYNGGGGAGDRVTSNYNPSNFGHYKVREIATLMNTAKKAKYGRFMILSQEYADLLIDERLSGSGLNTNVDPTGALDRGELPPFIGGFRVHVTNAFAAPEIIVGNSSTLGCVTSVPYVPAEEAGDAQYRTITDPETGLTLQMRLRWVTDPTEQWEITTRLYIGHKAIAEDTCWYFEAAA